MSEQSVLLITGAGRRVGKALAAHCARAGWRVAQHTHRSTPDALAGAELFQADLCDEAQTAALIPQVIEKMGRVDGLIHNASVFEKDGLEDFTWARAEQHARIHTLAATTLIQQLYAHRKAAGATGPAPAILLSDGLHGWSHSAAFLSYALSCAGLDALPQLLAEKLAPQLTINTLALGLTLPATTESDEYFARIAAHTPMGTPSNIEELQRSVDWLLASPSVTGQVISLAGGQHLARRIHLSDEG